MLLAGGDPYEWPEPARGDEVGPVVILTLNAGSSSLKFAVFDGASPILRGAIDTGHKQIKTDTTKPWPYGIEADGLTRLLAWIDDHDGHAPVSSVGHRVVHGGDRTGPARVNAGLIADLDALTPLAPLHQPHSLAAIRVLMGTHPHLPQVACFDTSFHHTMDAVTTTLPLPASWRGMGVRRYGFHGLSYAHVARQPGLNGRVIVAHLGSGASLCAMRDGRSVDTTMGMTALDGVMMATRPGRLDPGVLLWLLQARGLDAAAIENGLYHRSGLLGVGGAADLRALDPASLARAMFVRSVVRETGALVAVLGGVDAFVFTGGIGEHQSSVRADVGTALGWLGLAVDGRNYSYQPSMGLAHIGPSVWAIPADEEAEIARQVRALA